LSIHFQQLSASTPLPPTNQHDQQPPYHKSSSVQPARVHCNNPDDGIASRFRSRLSAFSSCANAPGDAGYEPELHSLTSSLSYSLPLPLPHSQSLPQTLGDGDGEGEGDRYRSGGRSESIESMLSLNSLVVGVTDSKPRAASFSVSISAAVCPISLAAFEHSEHKICAPACPSSSSSSSSSSIRGGDEHKNDDRREGDNAILLLLLLLSPRLSSIWFGSDTSQRYGLVKEGPGVVAPLLGYEIVVNSECDGEEKEEKDDDGGDDDDDWEYADLWYDAFNSSEFSTSESLSKLNMRSDTSFSFELVLLM
jgi:hypothetical protein